MRTYQISLLLLFIFGIQLSAESQTEIGLQSRHIFNQGAEVRLFNLAEESSFLDFNGLVLTLYRPREKRIFAYSFGLSIRDDFGDDFSTVPEIFVQVKIKLFKPLVEQPNFRFFFSLDPRIAYLSGDGLTPSFDMTMFFPVSRKTAGIEVPANLNFEYDLTDKLKIISHINVLSMAFFYDMQEVENPALTSTQQINNGFDFDGNIFNEFRIGLSYIFDKP